MTEQPVAIITGASRGIGAATAQRFAEKGYHLALVANDEPGLKQVEQTCRAAGVDVLCCAGDLADLDFARSAVDATVQRWGRLDVLVNNAAWREIVSMRRITLESWERTLRVSLTAPAFLSRWAAETMERQQSGVIINISSGMSQQAAGISPAYIAAKGALDALTYELASLYGPSNIRVVAINPGAIDTGLSDDLAGDAERTTTVRRFSEDMVMLRRWATADELARFIVAMAGDDASYLTGTTITIDGGWLRQRLPLSVRQKAYPEDFPS